MDNDKYQAHVRSDDFDVSSPHNGAIFYSNDKEGKWHLNRNSAKELGLTSLEDTAGGSWLDAQRTYESIESLDGQPTLWTKPNADLVWAETSTKFARNVSGNVTTRVIGAEEDTIFRSKELPALLENEKVTSINGVSREELKTLYDRDKEAAFNRVCDGELQTSREQVKVSNDVDARDDLQRREQLYEAQLANQENARAKQNEPKTYGQAKLDAGRAARNDAPARARDPERER